jgi:hypothetical protein
MYLKQKIPRSSFLSFFDDFKYAGATIVALCSQELREYPTPFSDFQTFVLSWMKVAWVLCSGTHEIFVWIFQKKYSEVFCIMVPVFTSIFAFYIIHFEKIISRKFRKLKHPFKKSDKKYFQIREILVFNFTMTENWQYYSLTFDFNFIRRIT